MKEKLYTDFLGLKSFNEIIEKFHNSIIDTNRGHKFFVDWEKIKKHVEEYKVELNILNSLIGSKDFDNDLINLLTKYPEILPAIPILIAIRDRNLRIIRDFLDKESDIVEYNFNERKLSEKEIQRFIEFFEKTGLKYFFENLSRKNIPDYITGVEVGLDTHARKNRSGKAMELVIEPILKQINSKISERLDILQQKYFRYIEKNLGFKVSPSLRNRKSDFIIIKNEKKVINIEVNFFRGTGSKPQEIVDSYINRQNDLKEDGFYFIWITDGEGWKGQRNQIKKGFRKIDYLLNLHFVREGLLEEILCKI